MKFAPVIITCPGREDMLAQTLASFAQTDFGRAGCITEGLDILIQRDTNQHERRQERQEHNSLSALKLALKEFPEADFVIFMEDDIVFNKHLRHNLENWKPMRSGEWHVPCNGNGCFFASLYDCTIRELKAFPAEHYFIADPNAVYGSQCYVISTNLAAYMVEHWWEVPGMQDIKMSRLAARLCPIHYHMPSLVQHVGYVSAWDPSNSRFHDTKSFDEWFKA